jgi:protein-S-isoprenylcysteine O-methyltransferase Ste14
MSQANRPEAPSLPILIARSAGQLVVGLGIWSGLLFSSAGTWHWPAAWLHLAIWVVTLSGNFLFLLPRHRDVLAARMNRKHPVVGWDAALLGGTALTIAAIPVVAGLDAVRYGWSQLSVWSLAVALPVHFFGDAIAIWALTVNPFAEKVVRIQSERGHRVISRGPYRWVRHPMYLGVGLMLLAMPPVLRSAWAFLPAGLTLLLMVVRTELEDRLLARDLPGYTAYARSTRWRLVPGIW